MIKEDGGTLSSFGLLGSGLFLLDFLVDFDVLGLFMVR